ncbi:integrase [Gossypium australe]|uniref:Integrase n=1 Tax=Gossypium australe TaxID=47621 RepID=A0A5B6UXJ8_9ROSI|nr:integrase [Gossypium australe]
MDFVVGQTLTSSKKNAIWVIVDRLKKSTHFLLDCTMCLCLLSHIEILALAQDSRNSCMNC